ncbi:type II toxin-antitoxin system RelE/ParE family toxin [Maricaulis sp.]|uniref:type II toxin-antitoxin system RelE/ParE family toxin n=1 Tax=Maricaulis sp. TaxID=1486257 RepID=UPI003A943E31
MIVSWKDKIARALAEDGGSPGNARWQHVSRIVVRKLAQLHAAELLLDLRSPPGNRLEALRGDRDGQHSIRVNDQWRICFRWTDEGPADVEVVDYH